MANVTFVTSALTVAANPTTTFAITIPTVATGDLLIVACTNRDATTTPSMVDNDGGTWTRKTSATSKGGLWYRYATSATSAKTITAGGTTAFTGSCSGVLIVLRGTPGIGDPFEQYTLEDNLTTDKTHGQITTVADGCWVGLAVSVVTNDDAVTNSATTSPGSLTEGNEKLSTGGLDCGTSIKGLAKATAGATGNATWTQASATTVSQLFAVRPSSAGSATALGGSNVEGGKVGSAPGDGAAGTGASVFVGESIAAAVAAASAAGGSAVVGEEQSEGTEAVAEAGATGTATGVGESIAAADGPAGGIAAALGVGSSTVEAVGAASATGGNVFVGGMVFDGIAVSAGIGALDTAATPIGAAVGLAQADGYSGFVPDGSGGSSSMAAGLAASQHVRLIYNRVRRGRP
jgi:hypothetical protein